MRRRVCDVFFLMIRRPPGSTQWRSSAASDVYKRQLSGAVVNRLRQDLSQFFRSHDPYPSNSRHCPGGPCGAVISVNRFSLCVPAKKKPALKAGLYLQEYSPTVRGSTRRADRCNPAANTEQPAQRPLRTLSSGSAQRRLWMNSSLVRSCCFEISCSLLLSIAYRRDSVKRIRPCICQGSSPAGRGLERSRPAVAYRTRAQKVMPTLKRYFTSVLLRPSAGVAS